LCLGARFVADGEVVGDDQVAGLPLVPVL
jgi:hypothetical protein